MIAAVVFDLDDTLFPEREFVFSGFCAVDKWLAGRGVATGFRQRAQALFQGGKRGRIFDEALADLGVPHDDAIIEEMVQVYREHKPNISLHPDARRAIDRFQGRQKLGIITDGYLAAQQNKVEALGVKSRFDAIIYSDLYGRDNWKPSPRPYLELMQALSCDGKACVYIGDNPQKDFLAATRLGWKTVQVCRPDGEHASRRVPDDHLAQWQIRTLDDLGGIVDRLVD